MMLKLVWEGPSRFSFWLIADSDSSFENPFFDLFSIFSWSLCGSDYLT